MGVADRRTRAPEVVARGRNRGRGRREALLRYVLLLLRGPSAAERPEHSDAENPQRGVDRHLRGPGDNRRLMFWGTD